MSGLSVTYVSTTSFTIVGDYTDILFVNRPLQFDCGVDGILNASVEDTSFGGGVTTVNIDNDNITSNLVTMEYSLFDPLAVPLQKYLQLDISKIMYVMDSLGSDDNSGYHPEQGFETIATGIASLPAGGILRVLPGTYTEVGLDFDIVAGLFLPNHGVVLDPATGNGLVVSGANSRVLCPDGSLLITPPQDQTGLVGSGSGIYLRDIKVKCDGGSMATSGDLGFDLTGTGVDGKRLNCADPDIAGFKIQGDQIKLDDCFTIGDPTYSSIGYWETNSNDKGLIINSGSQGHASASWQLDSGCTNIIVKKCYSGINDGHWIDNTVDGAHIDIQDKDGREYHEHVYPVPDGEGTAGDAIEVSSQVNDETGADDNKDYYGDCSLIIPVSTITVGWELKGINLFSTTVGDEQRLSVYRIVFGVSGTRNAGNDWDEGATVLTLQDAAEAALFLVDDLVWITSPNYVPNGEIVKVTDVTGAVVTIARQTENSARTGLHWDHTTNDGGNEVMYLAHRDVAQYHMTNFDFSSDATRGFTAYRWDARRMAANDGLVMRMINGTDDAESKVDVTAIWSE